VIVMPANNTGIDIGILIGTYPGRVGHLYSPGRNPEPRKAIPYALDNGAYPIWEKGGTWDDDVYRAHVKAFAHNRHSPRWILVPDVVTQAKATLDKWHQWSPELRAFGHPLALAVQDGMNWYDVPSNADVIFVGGSTEWKWKSLPMWCRKFPRVHVGRVNSVEKLWVCHDFGCESCDGTGWFRGDKNQRDGLEAYLRESSGARQRQQMPMFMVPDVPDAVVAGQLKGKS